jgi:hypothetical protein
MQKTLLKLGMAGMTLVTLGVVGMLAYLGLQTTQTIRELLGDNKQLRSAITNLTETRQIGYAKVLGQETREGQLFTKLLFVATEPEDPTRRVIEREYEIEGDVVFFDALIVKFGTELVMDGREKAMYLWRRVYGESMSPSMGHVIEMPGEIPVRYRELTARLKLDQQQLFWDEIWALADDPDRLADIGVQAVYGNVVYKKLRPGLIYVFKIEANGALYPEIVPDL